MSFKSRIRRTVAALLGRVFPTARVSLRAKWELLREDVDFAVRERRFDQLEERIGRLLQWVNQLPEGEPSIPEKLNFVGELYQTLSGSYEAAEKCFRRAVVAACRLYGEGCLEQCPGLNNLGLLLLDQRRYSEAEEVLRRLLPVVSDQCGEESVDFASCLENLAAVLRQTNREKEAAEARNRALRIRRTLRERPRGTD